MKETGGNCTRLVGLTLGNDLKGLAYRAVWVSPGRGDVGVSGVARGGLGISR